MRLVRHYIAGEDFQGAPARSGDVTNPATGEVIAQCAFASSEEVDLAVASAKEAFQNWRYSSLSKRSSIMFKFRELLASNKDELARLLTLEHGKVLGDARGEVQRGLEVVEFACGIPQLLKGDFSENVSTLVDCHQIRQPIGVVVGITPFNFPAMVPMWMYPIAIACGNTFVLKPSEKNPSTHGLIAKMLTEAGLPAGVFNIVHGDKVAVDGLIEHPDVAAVSFVGSTPVAKYVHEKAFANGKRVQALSGAKNHMIVLPDADMELAADSAMNAAYGSAGERCMAVSVLVTVGNAADKLLPLLQKKIANINVGDGMSDGSDMGPLITQAHCDRVRKYVDQGSDEGAELLVDGRELQVADREKGFFLGPCLFDRVTPEMSIYRDEIFGPVLSTVRVDSYEEAMELLRSNPWANGVALFTNDGGAARKFQTEAEVGMIGINVPIPVPMAYHSFGGWKASLFGDYHVHGMEGVRFMTRTKAVTVRWPDPSQRGKNLGFPTQD
jgi:malonate-semialdehyde dehydrogenase (acetylating) / methylmalonate-semialdehyde dehydrogenase